MAMFEAVEEIAIYIHRFHNLDLLHQGWYQIKVTMRWEDNENMSFGVPTRVVQYEAPDLSPGSVYGVWRIGDADNSFSTQPFRIKYARQDVHLCTMISFNLSLCRFKGLPTTAVILKFELMYAPTVGNDTDLQAALDAYPAAVHEFRIPPKALLGLHSYCPVHFDVLHAALVDVSVHVSLLRAATCPYASKVSRNSRNAEVVEKSYDALNHRGNDALDLLIAEKLHPLSKRELLDCFHSAGDQLLYLWNTFLKLHRDKETKILELLRDDWARDRKAEWSIWMVYSKVAMPHHYINSGNDESSYRGVHKRVSSLLKLSDESLQTAATRAELHRRSIAQMKINNQSIQDMQMYGDPLRIPIVIVEHVMNAPQRTISENSYTRNFTLADSHNFLAGLNLDTANKESVAQSNVRALKIVVFVHGFQGHHLDLRLIRNQWLLIDPMVEVLMSQANEDKTSGDLREMGQRLAQEVVSFVKNKMDEASRYANLGDIRLSFVGHSIGNLIIRTSIADSMMEPFLRYLHTYVSVSGPHLGYLYSSNSLFNSGLWILKKLKGTQCIHQLTFTDDPDIWNTFLYKLCMVRKVFYKDWDQMDMSISSESSLFNMVIFISSLFSAEDLGSF
ncbi:hypothetical protein RYX36_022136 [Vicia faba]